MGGGAWPFLVGGVICLFISVNDRLAVCAFNTSPCVRSERPSVYWQQAHMFHTCGLGAGTHADVLNVHTEAF